MYSTGVIIAVLIGGLIATAASSTPYCTPKRTRDPSTIPSTPIKTFTGFTYPWNIFITDDNIAYIPEYDGTTVQQVRSIDNDGNTLNVVSVPGYPTSVKVLGGEVYVTDMTNDKIRRYTRDLVAISSRDFSATDPVSIAVDSNGNIYASQHLQGKVNVYKDDGTKTGEIDFNVPGALKYVRNIRFDCNQVLFGSIYFESSIYSYTTDGVLVNQFTLSGSDYVTYTNGPFVDDNGNIYVADFSNGMIRIMDSSGTVIKSFQSAGQYISDVAMGPDGIIWVVDYYQGKIYLY